MSRGTWHFTKTNWTFGFWYSKVLRRWGIDLGPLEFVSNRR